MVSESVATSTTLARNICTISSTWLRVPASARTLMSMTWRCTADCGSSSTTLRTSTSLLSCLVTCSSGNSSTSTTTVIREMSECSVGPTARESMLKPRREKRPAMRARTPGLSSTRTDRVCLLIVAFLSVLAVPHGGLATGVEDLVVADTGGDHRPDHRIRVHDEVDDDRAVVDLQRLLDHRVDVLLLLRPQPEAAVGLGQLDEVRDPLVAAGVQVGVGVALVVEQRLPLPHHAEAGVVDDRDLDGDLVDDAGGQLLVRHLEATVAVDRPHDAVRLAHLGAHGRRHRVAHRPEATGVEPGVRPLVLDVLGCPHLVLADTGDVDALRAGELPDPLDDVLGLEAVRVVGVAQREGGLPLLGGRPPLAVVGVA